MKRFLSLCLSLVMCLSLLPAPALAGLAGEYASGEKAPAFTGLTLSGAGCTSMNDWAMGEDCAAQEDLGDEASPAEFLKTRIMIRCMNFEAFDPSEPIAFFVPESGFGSARELTLYGKADLAPEDIAVSCASGSVEKHVFGGVDSEGGDDRVFWYTVPVSPRSGDTELTITVAGELFATVPIHSVSAKSPVALYTTLQVLDYEEGAGEDTIESMTLRVSGFSLPDDPALYTLTWRGSDGSDDPVSITAAAVSAPDAYGYRSLRFAFPGGVDGEALTWASLGFRKSAGGETPEYDARFFDWESHLTELGGGKYQLRQSYGRTVGGSYEPYADLGGTDGLVPSPYYCIFKEPDTGVRPKAPTDAGVVVTASGLAAEQRGGAWILTGEETDEYTFWASAPAGLSLEAVFETASGTEVLTRGLGWNDGSGRYELTIARGLLKSAERVKLRVAADGEIPAGRERVLQLRTLEPVFIRALFAPAVPAELKDDGTGTRFYAVAPGATISGTFEASAGFGRSQRMTLTYLDAAGASRTAAAGASEYGNGCFRAELKLPADADRLTKLSYELLEDGALAGSVDFDLSDHRVYARMFVTGIPADYVGTTFTLKGANTRASVVVTEDRREALPLGDLPTGSYTWELSGRSGHITGGTADVTRGEDLALGALPALGSFTAEASGFASAISGQTVLPPSAVVLDLTAPDGAALKLRGVPGVKMEQIPVGSMGSASLEWDTNGYDEVMGCSPASAAVTISGDESASFAFEPFTFRTISGNAWGLKTYADGSSFASVPWGTVIVATQEITRGGKTETVRFTAEPDHSYSARPRGKWSLKCYDGIPVKLELRCLQWDTVTKTVTESGDVNVGEMKMTYGGETTIELRAVVQTPGSVRADGTPFYSASDSVSSSVASGFLNVGSIWLDSGVYRADSGKYSTFVQDGQTFLQLAAGVTAGVGEIDVSAGGSVDYGDMTLSVPFGDYVRVKTDAYGNPYAEFTAVNSGGEFRATVVEDPESEYTGFLVFFVNDHWSVFTSGKGELILPYGGVMTGKGGTAVALMVRDTDAAEMAELLSTSAKRLYDLLPKSGGWDSYTFNQEYGRKIKYQSVTAFGNSAVYLEGLVPEKPMGTSLLPPYSFSCRYELTDSMDTIRVVGTLEKRYPEETGQDELRAVKLFTTDGGAAYTAEDLRAEPGFSQQSLGAGRYLITAELPLDSLGTVCFNLQTLYWHESEADDRGEHTLDFFRREYVPIFTMINPGAVYIADQLDAQHLAGKPEEAQRQWKLNLAIRAVCTGDTDADLITVYDNGVEIDRFNVYTGRVNMVSTSGIFRRQVALTDNLRSGVHTVWASRTIDGETFSTEPESFLVISGHEHNNIYISDLEWTHWNHRIGWSEDTPDRMYFKNLSELAGANVWIWPGKKHQMRFIVHNATSEELDGVNVVYQQQCAIGNLREEETDLRGVYRGFVRGAGYSTVVIERAIPCRLVFEDKNANYSIWEFKDKYMGYLESFDFEFVYNAATRAEIQSLTAEELDRLESERFYETCGLGDYPDDAEMIAGINAMTGEQILESLAGMSEASHLLGDLDLRVSENSDDAFRMELVTPTDMISEYSVSMEAGESAYLPDLWMLMEQERENGSQRPDEQGWTVRWAEIDGEQGSTLIRFASFDGVDAATGRNALLSHTTYYLPAALAEALGGIGAGLMEGEDPGKPDHWLKQSYDASSIVYSAADIANEGWKSFCHDTHLYWNPGDLKGAKEWANESSFLKSQGLGNTFKALGVVDAVVTYAGGPSGADPKDLRSLLANVRDERARRSLEQQIRDYEQLRSDIHKQDCTMSTLSAASNFAPTDAVCFWGKLALFIGGTANSIISGWSKDYNRQVYNTTLHDIQRQLKFEAYKAERLRKSAFNAEQWLRDRMDSIYGKGRWSEYALAEERKNWVLVEYPGAVVKYVWKQNVPKFNVVLDPAGFVFEAVEDQPLEGVRTTVYFSETEDGSYSVWHDAYTGQPNPQTTGEGGAYQWMVPYGWWKVRYEKDGYETAESKPMPVPPEHTQVNIGLRSLEAPKAGVSVGSGEITVAFSKYMQLESLVKLYGGGDYGAAGFDASGFAVQFYDASGAAVPGTVTFPDRRENSGYKGMGYGQDVIASDYFTAIAVFTPEDRTLDLSGVTWRIADGPLSYAGVPLDTEGADGALRIVLLDPNGGTAGAARLATTASGTLRSLPAAWREGYDFLGWFTARDGGERVTTDTVFTESTAIYAHWEREAAASDPTEDYVARAYSVILGREGDDEGIAHWVSELSAGASAGEIIREFFRSEEYRDRALSNAETVRLCYEAMLSRAPDAEGLANWTALLDDGYSTTKLVAEFVDSAEFAAICESYGLTAGTIALDARDQNSNITRFVQRCYEYALNRPADEAGLNEWCDHLLTKDLDPERVAFGFIFSDEAKAHGLDDAAFIEMLYRMMLDRAPDEGVANWVESLSSLTAAEVAWAEASGERTAEEAVDKARQTIYVSFAASEEFANMIANFGF